MLLATLGIALRAGTVALLLLLAALLVRDFRGAVAGRLAIALALGSAAHAVSSAAGFDMPATLWRASLIALSTGNVVVFWLFARALFDDGFRLRGWHVLPWAAVAAISLFNCLLLGPAPADFRILGTGVNSIVMSLIALGFIALAVGQSVASWSVDLVESRRRLRVFIVAAAAVYGGANAIMQLLTSGTEAPGMVNTANAVVLAGVVVAITCSLLRVNGEDVFSFPATETVANAVGGTGGIKGDAAAAADQKLIDALTRLMADDRIYRDEQMTIGMLALRLAVPEYRLRRLINQRLGYRNFNVFLNDHRIAEAKAALADPSQAQVPVITIAMDAGFQSLGPFNRAFKATTGVTPSEYRRLNRTPVAPSKPLLSTANFEIG